MRQYFFALILTFFYHLGIGQDVLYIHGNVVNKKYIGIDQALVIIKKDGISFDTLYTDKNGEFEGEMILGPVYQIKFWKPDYIYKIIQFNTNMSAEAEEGGFDYPLEITLFKPLSGMDLSVYDAPIGIADYVEESNSIEFDLDYTKHRKELIQQEIERVEKLDFERKLQANRKFKKQVKKGDKLAAKSKYLQAIKHYKAAMLIYPETGVLERKIDEIYAEIE